MQTTIVLSMVNMVWIWDLEHVFRNLEDVFRNLEHGLHRNNKSYSRTSPSRSLFWMVTFLLVPEYLVLHFSTILLASYLLFTPKIFLTKEVALQRRFYCTWLSIPLRGRDTTHQQQL